MTQRQRVLITGASGHVGGRLFRELSSRPEVDTRALLRIPQRLPTWASTSEIFYGDLTSPSVQASVLQDTDVVVHLATRGFSAIETPTPTEAAIEYESTLALAKRGITLGLPRFIFVSSIHVFGSALGGVVHDASPTNPESVYGSSRLKIEDDLLTAAAETSTEIVIVRMTNSFGTPALPRPATWTLLLHDMCRQVIERSTITLRSDDRTCRDMIALRDAIQVLGEVISSPHISTGRYLLASGQTMTIRALAELVQTHVAELFGFRPAIISSQTSNAPPSHFSLESRRLREAGIVIPNRRDDEIRELLMSAAREFEASRQ